MSQLIDRAGLWLAKIRDFAVSTTSKQKLPQFVVDFQITHKYNDETEQWDDWTQYDETYTALGYFVLVHENAAGEIVKCFTYDHLIDALGWDGESYASLATGNWKGKVVQIRTLEDEYNGQIRYKVQYIAAEGAEVGLRKLSADAVAALDAKFSVAGRTKAKPAKAPAKKAKPKTAPKVTPKAEKPVAACTEDEAYGACVAANGALGEKASPDEIVNDYWIGAIQEIAKDTDAVTPEEWAKIRDDVLVKIDIPF